MKLITFLNLELISAVLFAIVTLVGPSGYFRISVQAIIFVFILLVLVYYVREKKGESKEAQEEKPEGDSKDALQTRDQH